MSKSHTEKIRCPSCRKKQQATIWDSVNVTVDPELKPRLLARELTTFTCRYCGISADLESNCLYHDMDKGILVWLMYEGSVTGELRAMFDQFGEHKIRRTVSSINDFIEKIGILDNGLDDFEIELFKFCTCIKMQIDLATPFYFIETESASLTETTLVFAIQEGDEPEAIGCLLSDFKAAIAPTMKKIQPSFDRSELNWAQLDRNFILKLFQKTKMVEPVTEQKAQTKQVRVHTIGKEPKFNDPQEYYEWSYNGHPTYTTETWTIGKHLSEKQAIKYRDKSTGEFYVHYKIVDGKWKGRFIKRDLFLQIKAVMDS